MFNEVRPICTAKSPATNGWKKRNVKSFVLQMYICKLGYTQEFTINKISFELSNKNVICKSTKDYSLMLKKNDNS